jgi:hypothetical protein
MTNNPYIAIFFDLICSLYTMQRFVANYGVLSKMKLVIYYVMFVFLIVLQIGL